MSLKPRAPNAFKYSTKSPARLIPLSLFTFVMAAALAHISQTLHLFTLYPILFSAAYLLEALLTLLQQEQGVSSLFVEFFLTGNYLYTWLQLVASATALAATFSSLVSPASSLVTPFGSLFLALTIVATIRLLHRPDPNSVKRI
jgi:hypothetical protein